MKRYFRLIWMLLQEVRIFPKFVKNLRIILINLVLNYYFT
uniref:Uncharacterized protein n=4 Tax=Enterobacteriaceae TaxID=543 RepID=A0A7M1HX39_ECOLX|nr:hypothetical protein KPH11_87 [Klebsiella pneumoniae subsp. pneumoniae]APA23001.1 hypothetical protein [Salmonella enterica subsp. enterica serovar Typhimurium]QOQ30877.1 hypothetical protein [Escherichia coli]